MRLEIVAIGSVLVLVFIGVTLDRTGHPRAVAPLIFGLTGILVTAAGLLFFARMMNWSTAARPAPTVAVTGTAAPMSASTVADACRLPMPAPATGRLPRTGPADVQKLPGQFPALPLVGGPLLRSHATQDPSGMPDVIGAALADYDVGQYYLPPNDGRVLLTVSIGTPRATGCAHDLVIAALGHDFGQPVRMLMIEPGPHLAGDGARIGCAELASDVYDVCAWAADNKGAPLFGEVRYYWGTDKLADGLSQAAVLADEVFGIITGRHL